MTLSVTVSAFFFDVSEFGRGRAGPGRWARGGAHSILKMRSLLRELIGLKEALYVCPLSVTGKVVRYVVSSYVRFYEEFLYFDSAGRTETPVLIAESVFVFGTVRCHQRSHVLFFRDPCHCHYP